MTAVKDAITNTTNLIIIAAEDVRVDTTSISSTATGAINATALEELGDAIIAISKHIDDAINFSTSFFDGVPELTTADATESIEDAVTEAVTDATNAINATAKAAVDDARRSIKAASRHSAVISKHMEIKQFESERELLLGGRPSSAFRRPARWLVTRSRSHKRKQHGKLKTARSAKVMKPVTKQPRVDQGDRVQECRG